MGGSFSILFFMFPFQGENSLGKRGAELSRSHILFHVVDMISWATRTSLSSSHESKASYLKGLQRNSCSIKCTRADIEDIVLRKPDFPVHSGKGIQSFSQNSRFQIPRPYYLTHLLLDACNPSISHLDLSFCLKRWNFPWLSLLIWLKKGNWILSDAAWPPNGTWLLVIGHERQLFFCFHQILIMLRTSHSRLITLLSSSSRYLFPAMSFKQSLSGARRCAGSGDMPRFGIISITTSGDLCPRHDTDWMRRDTHLHPGDHLHRWSCPSGGFQHVYRWVHVSRLPYGLRCLLIESSWSWPWDSAPASCPLTSKEK